MLRKRSAGFKVLEFNSETYSPQRNVIFRRAQSFSGKAVNNFINRNPILYFTGGGRRIYAHSSPIWAESKFKKSTRTGSSGVPVAIIFPFHLQKLLPRYQPAERHWRIFIIFWWMIEDFSLYDRFDANLISTFRWVFLKSTKRIQNAQFVSGHFARDVCIWTLNFNKIKIILFNMNIIYANMYIRGGWVIETDFEFENLVKYQFIFLK